MWFGIISLFPEMFVPLNYGITGKAIKNGIIQYQVWNPRDFAQDKYKTVDDRPYGGGPGMVLMAPPLQAAIQAAKKCAPSSPKIIYLSPQGTVLNQAELNKYGAKPRDTASVNCSDETSANYSDPLSANCTGKPHVTVPEQSFILIAGRYEGIDERILELEIDEEWSIGDYVLSGGELAAMVIIDALTRLLPGALGDEDSMHCDSLMDGLLKYPQYTRPDNYHGHVVPDILLSGDHKKIEIWRQKQSLGKTWLKRPDLLAKVKLTNEQKNLLSEFIEEYRNKRK